ncbi:MAG: hypothetical protein QXX17_01020 [Conexivisphaerales archaeon]
MKAAKTAIIGEVLQVRKGRRRIEVVLAPQDIRPEGRMVRRLRVPDGEELETQQLEQIEENTLVEPAWSFYLSKTVFEALGRPTVGSEIMVTLTQIR